MVNVTIALDYARSVLIPGFYWEYSFKTDPLSGDGVIFLRIAGHSHDTLVFPDTVDADIKHYLTLPYNRKFLLD